MKSIVISFCLFTYAICLTPLLKSEVILDSTQKVWNEQPGYCAFCSIEMCARYQGIKKLYGLKDNRKKEPEFIELIDEYGNLRIVNRNLGYSFAVRKKLDDLGVEYLIGYDSQSRQKIFDYAIKHNLPFTIVLKPGWDEVGYNFECHAVVVTKFGDKFVTYIDPNSPTRERITDRNWLDRNIIYWALVLKK
jgi:hypothetical protein